MCLTLNKLRQERNGERVFSVSVFIYESGISQLSKHLIDVAGTKGLLLAFYSGFDNFLDREFRIGGWKIRYHGQQVSLPIGGVRRPSGKKICIQFS